MINMFGATRHSLNFINLIRPEVIDRALLRPGRLGELLHVPLPSPDDRGLILQALAKKKPVDTTVDLVAFGKDDSCNSLSGADLAALVCHNCIKEYKCSSIPFHVGVLLLCADYLAHLANCIINTFASRWTKLR